ncbi:Nitric oxide-associated protein 1 [Nymphon striatum]|nr:Nitric oxide-associated protein 1 [Nymphon striatum]
MLKNSYFRKINVTMKKILQKTVYSKLRTTYSNHIHPLISSSVRTCCYKNKLEDASLQIKKLENVSNSIDIDEKPVSSLLGDGINFKAARLFNLRQRKKWDNKSKKNIEINASKQNSAVALRFMVNDDFEKEHPGIFDQNDTDPKVIPEDLSHPYSHYDELNTEDKHVPEEMFYANDSDLLQYNSDVDKSSHLNLPSVIPCSGCGSILHCKDESIPGYMPRDKFLLLSEQELCNEICRRCFFLKNYNTAIGVNISPEEYEVVLSEIKYKQALVILMVDLLPCDQRQYLDVVKIALQQSLKDNGIDCGNNIKHIALISAKTGFGVENLINKLQVSRQGKGDVYLVGCTNVGKSTLFNVLLQSDLCKKQASDIIPPATTSVWPGTTLSLLKFPIFRMSEYDRMERNKRLLNQQKEDAAQAHYNLELYRKSQDKSYVTLFGTVQKTAKRNEVQETNLKNEFSLETPPTTKVFNSEDQEFKNNNSDVDYEPMESDNETIDSYESDDVDLSEHEDILDLLTTDELLKVLPKDMVIPRTIQVRSAQTLFVSGLARIDLIMSEKQQILMTIFSSSLLPIHLVDTKEADLFYTQNIGTEFLGAPLGNENRLSTFPALNGKEFSVVGKGNKKSCADIVLSSVGWVSITGDYGVDISLCAYSPDGRGIHLRQPSVLPFAVNLRGHRIKGVPAFKFNFPSIRR